MKTISVLIVTYNQEDVIRRTLDSVLVQKDFGLHKIVVCDDCSKDSTWLILEEYKEKYPDIMDIHQNEHNLGIYPNMEKVVSLRPKSDLFYKLAGDDALCPLFFEKIQDVVIKNNVDTSKAVGLFFDWKSVLPNGKEYIINQSIVEKFPNSFSLYLRGKVCLRSGVVSESVLAKYTPVIKDKGLSLAEALFDSQDHLYIEEKYYYPYIASIYYAGIGVSTSLEDSKSEYKTTQAIEKYIYLRDNIATDPLDKKWLNYCIEKDSFIMKPSVRLLIKVLLMYWGCHNAYYGITLKDRLLTYRSLLRTLIRK